MFNKPNLFHKSSETASSRSNGRPVERHRCQFSDGFR